MQKKHAKSFRVQKNCTYETSRAKKAREVLSCASWRWVSRAQKKHAKPTVASLAALNVTIVAAARPSGRLWRKREWRYV